MADVNVEEVVKRIVCERLDRKPEQVTLDAKFIGDLGADSLDVTELLILLEEEFQIDIDDEATKIETVGDAIKFIASRV